MKYYSFSTIISLCSLLTSFYGQTVRGDASPNKIDVTVAFEADDDASRSFLLTQLAPLYNALSDVINLELTPFGRANIDIINRTVECFHGQGECVAHAFEQCAMLEYPNPEEYLKFISLVSMLPSGFMNQKIAYEKIAALSELDAKVIEDCALDIEKSFDLQHAAAKKTPIYAAKIPWVEVDGEFVDIEDDESLWDAICDALLDDGEEELNDDEAFCLNENIGKPRKYKGIKAKDVFASNEMIRESHDATVVTQ